MTDVTATAHTIITAINERDYETSSGPKKRHRLNPRGNRQLNHALHVIAMAQISHERAGRVYYERKIAEGKTKKEAMRSLKRRITDVVYRALVADRTDTE